MFTLHQSAHHPWLVSRLGMLLSILLAAGMIGLGGTEKAQAYYPRIIVEPLARTVNFVPVASRGTYAFDYLLKDDSGNLLDKNQLLREGYNLPECGVPGLDGNYWPAGVKTITCSGGWDPDSQLVFDTSATATLTVTKIPLALSYIGPLSSGQIKTDQFSGLSFNSDKVGTSVGIDECFAGTSGFEGLNVVVSPNPLTPTTEVPTGSLNLLEAGYDPRSMSIDSWAPGTYSVELSFPESEYCQASNVVTKTLVVTSFVRGYTPSDVFEVEYGTAYPGFAEYYVRDESPQSLAWMTANMRNFVAPTCYNIYGPNFYSPTSDAGTRFSYRCQGGSADGWTFTHLGAGGTGSRSTFDIVSASSYLNYSGTAHDGSSASVAIGDDFNFSTEAVGTSVCLASLQYVVTPDPLGIAAERIFGEGTQSTSLWGPGDYQVTAQVLTTRNVANTRDNCIGASSSANFSLRHHVSIVPFPQAGVLGLSGPSEYGFSIVEGGENISLAQVPSYIPPLCSTTYDPESSTELHHQINCVGGSADGYEFDVSQTSLLTLINPQSPSEPVDDNPPFLQETGIVLEVGQQVAGAPVTFSGSGLEPGSYWEVVVRSTPIVIASGYVSSDGTYSAVAYMPVGLDPGVHRIIWEGIGVDGSPIVSTVFLAVGQGGELLYKSEPTLGNDSGAIEAALQAAETAVDSASLALTGLNQDKNTLFLGIAGLFIVMGLISITTSRARKKDA